MITVAVVVAIAAVAVPAVIVPEGSVIAFPVAFIIAGAVMARANPVSTLVGRTGPVAVMPSVLVPVGIPIALDPDIAGARSHRVNADHALGWRRSNIDSDGEVDTEQTTSREQEHC